MRDPRPLLAAVCEDPDDILPRLAYADWLEENGDPADGAQDRAEFIRLQLSLAGRDPRRPGRPPAEGARARRVAGGEAPVPVRRARRRASSRRS
jgi:uncharacterized protein (TIGR02996 family)